jgi:hypothetical protein
MAAVEALAGGDHARVGLGPRDHGPMPSRSRRSASPWKRHGSKQMPVSLADRPRDSRTSPMPHVACSILLVRQSHGRLATRALNPPPCEDHCSCWSPNADDGRHNITFT